MDTKLVVEQAYWRGKYLSLRGTLTLFENRLHFEPAATSKIAGAKELTFNVHNILRAHFEGVERTLVIEYKNQRECFHGPGARIVGERLIAVMATFRSDIFSLSDFEASEQIISRGETLRYTSDLLGVSGEYVLSTHCLRFVPHMGLQQFIWSELELEIPLSKIKSVKQKGLGRLLVIESELGTVRFGGSASGHLARTLQALLYADELDENPLLANWDAVYFKGPLAQHGDLRIYGKEMHFVPQGMIELLFGFHGVQFKTEHLHRIILQGTLQKRLHFDVQKRVFSFGIQEPEDRFMELAQMLVTISPPNQIQIDDRGRVSSWENVYRTLQPWFRRLPAFFESPHELFTTAVLWRNKARILERGYLCLTRTHVIFFPYCGPRGRVRALSMHVHEIKRSGPRDENEPPLVFFHGKKRVCLLTTGGQQFADEFWARVSEITFTPRVDENSTEAQDGPNRRNSFRIAAPVGVAIKLELQADQNNQSRDYVIPKPITPALLNLSQGGCGILSEERLAERQEYKIELQLGPDLIHVKGEIRAVKKQKEGYRAGIKFLAMDKETRRTLQSAYMEYQQIEIANRLES